MLKTLDILIGLSLVMLVVSMVVTMLTQAVTSAFNSRGRHLLHGLSDLLQQIDPGLKPAIAQTISAAVLSHPLIRDVGSRYGSVIHREELTKILMELATDEGPQKLEAAAKQKLLDALRANQVPDPSRVLANVRSLALQLEISNPELATNARHAVALLHEANSQFVAKVNNWFDQTMDRVSERFTFTTRGITFACALVLSLVIQFDTVSLVNRLSADDQLRAQLVQEAMKQQKAPDQSQEDGRRQLAMLAASEVVTMPGSYAEWKANWSRPDLPPKIPGILLSALLLSLGAPFWYNALRNLLRLRSLIASKDDQQRLERQSTQSAVQTPVGPAAAQPSLLVGERGDLGSLG